MTSTTRRGAVAAVLAGLALAGGIAAAPGALAIQAPPNPSTPNPANGAIAYVDLDNGSALQAVSADGSSTSTLFTAPSCTQIRDVVDSPNGDRLAFALEPASSSCDGTSSIWTITNGGTGLTQITSGGYDVFPTWSSDESYLAFIRDASATSATGRITRVNADGTGVTAIGPDDQATWVSWSPDGSKLLFGSNNGNGSARSIRTIAWDGSGLATVVGNVAAPIGNGVYPAGQAVWTSGDRIVVAGSNHASGYAAGETCVLLGITLSSGAAAEVYRAPVTGNGGTCAYLPRDGGRNLTVAPDATQLAFSSAPLSSGGGYDFGTLSSATVPAGGGAATALAAPRAYELSWMRIVYGPRPTRGRR